MNLRAILVLAAGLGFGTSANAELFYTFTSGLDGFGNASWSATGPVGWAGGAALQATNNAGGWTLGGGGPTKDLTAEPGAMSLFASGTARLSFDVIVDGTTFTGSGANWYQVNIAGNSDGSTGWTQVKVVDSWHNADDNTLLSTHVDLGFSEVGWQAGDTWSQLWFGGNTDAAFPLKFYVDNVRLTEVPEPSSAILILGGLGCLAFIRSGRSAGTRL